MPVLFRVLLLVSAGVATAYWIGHRSTEPGNSRQRSATTLKASPPQLPPYSNTLERIEGRRQQLARTMASTHPAQRAEVLSEARRLLQTSLARDLPAHWLGTPWDFNGISQTPGEGQIACGYFVSTLLRDTGFQVERIRLAQQPSGNIIRTLTPRSNVKRLIGKGFDEFLAELDASGPGIYVIGLDRHVGLIAKTNESAAFIHSDGGRHKCVIVEPVERSESLKRSRWREFANLSADETLLEKWLENTPLPTAGS